MFPEEFTSKTVTDQINTTEVDQELISAKIVQELGEPSSNVINVVSWRNVIDGVGPWKVQNFSHIPSLNLSKVLPTAQSTTLIKKVIKNQKEIIRIVQILHDVDVITSKISGGWQSVDIRVCIAKINFYQSR